MIRVLVLNGPNLNLLGTREPEVYGTATLAQIEADVSRHAEELSIEVKFLQSNHEGELVDAIHRAGTGTDGMIVNLGAYTHTSLAIRDAFLAVPIPFVEVHLSNIFKREAARQHSMVADLALGMITGFGSRGYILALDALFSRVKGA